MPDEDFQDSNNNPPSAVASSLLSVFLICYLGYETWYRWDFVGQHAVKIASGLLFLAFCLIYIALRQLELWVVRHWAGWGQAMTFLFAFATVVTMSFYLNPDARHERWVKQFDPHLKHYTSLRPVDVERPYDFLRRRIVTVERNRVGQRIKVTTDRLNRRLRADSPAEIESVVWLDWSKKQLPQPENAVVEVCHVRAIDLKTRELTAEKTIEAKWRLVNVKPKGRRWSGHLNDTKIYKYLRNLRIKE